MSSKLNQQRRDLIKIGLTLPFLSCQPTYATAAAVDSTESFYLTNDILDELYKIYGKRSYSINLSDTITLKLPEIAENGSVVPISITGDAGFVSSFAIFVAKNLYPLAAICYLNDGADLSVSLRLKVEKTSDIIVVADTNQGLYACKQLVKVTIGCGGG